MKYVLLLLLLSVCQLTSAEETAPASGLDLLNHCRVYTELSPMPWGFKVLDTNPSVGICLSYMSGLLDQTGAVQQKTAGSYCLPQDITAGQLIAVFVTYAEKYPQLLNQDQDSAVHDLLGKVFPCKGKP